MSRTTARLLGLAACLASAAVVAFLIWTVFIRPGQDRQAARQSASDSAYAQGDARASNAAAGAVADLGERNQARDELSRGTSDEINSLPGARLQVDADVHAAGRRRNCLRASYANTPACVRLRAEDSAAAPR